ncbi:ChaB family protein [Alsobacter sp. R-9]
MPWRHIGELPPAVRDHLPLHAQEIFLAAFNSAWTERIDDPDVEATAFRIAWGAVKRFYRKDGQAWVPKREEPPGGP